jgi:hypothetical protein
MLIMLGVHEIIHEDTMIKLNFSSWRKVGIGFG